MIFLLLCMIFCHIVDDYYLQGQLASMKQKSWWMAHAPNKLYQYDYIMALLMHSFSWAFMVMLIPFLYNYHYNNEKLLGWCYIFFLANLLIHMVVDYLKANEKSINLIADQLMHMAQISITWAALIQNIL